MNTPSKRQPAPRRQRGVSLVEVLVSVLVLGIGMLGAVALQGTALRNNQGSYERTQTAILTQAMLDALRANPSGVAAGEYNTVGLICAAPATNNLATRDLARWIGDLHAQVNSSACGEVNCAGNACTVRVRWDDSHATGGSATQDVTLAARL